MSTVAELLAAYDDAADYDEDGSVTKAKAFRTACRRLLALPKESTQGNRHRIVMSPEQLRQSIDDATAFINSHSTAGGSVTHPDFRSLR